MNLTHLACFATLFVSFSSSSGILRHDTQVQDYRDFAENFGKYRIGVSNIPVYKKNGELDAVLPFSMPDMGSVSRRGFAGLIAPSYVSSVRHVTSLGSVFFGGQSAFSPRYIFINRNEVDAVIDQDYMLPRLNKVVTEIAPVERVESGELRAGIGTRYTAFVRVGAGYQRQVNDQLDGLNALAGAYAWLSGGTINPDIITTKPNYLYWIQYSPDDPRASPLSNASQSGDSGSPVYAYDAIDKKWKLVAANQGRSVVKDKYGTETRATLIPDGYFDSIVAAHVSPDVTDEDASRPIYWNSGAINQGHKSWGWQGLAENFRHLAPAKASLRELDASKDLRFNGAGGDIVLTDAVNLGAGKLQFSNNYTVKSADGVNATWVGGGVEVDADQRVLWQVNGLADDNLHKIGAGILHINATGINAGGLNVGDGTVILDQQADDKGKRQAFSQLFIVSGRPTVILNGADQVAGDNIFFGYRGGKLDLNGNALTMRTINHTDAGAILLNQNKERNTNLTLTGFTANDVSIKEWQGNNAAGVIGDIYEDYNSNSKRIEYFQLKTPTYSWFPTNQKDNSYWKYIGFDAQAAQAYRASQLNQLVYRGYIGSNHPGVVNGGFEINFSPTLNDTRLALTGGINLNGNINVFSGTLLLSGQPVPHAGGVEIEDDWFVSRFAASNVVIANNARFQIGEYAQVQADIQAGDHSQLLLGFQPDGSAEQQILRCTAPIYSSVGSCNSAQRNAQQLHNLPASLLHGDITLGDQSELYLGKIDFRGAITDRQSSHVFISDQAFWNLTASSRMHRLSAQKGGIISFLPAADEVWSPKQLRVEYLTANNLQIGLGIAPQSGLSDSLYIDGTTQGSGNTIDLGFMLGESFPERIPQNLVLLDAPGGTAHNFFTLPALRRGFSLYTPDYQVVEDQGRVKWVIAKTPDVITPPEPVIDPVPEPGKQPDPKPEIKPDPESKPGAGKPEDWFNVSDDQRLVKSTRTLLSSRQYLFNEAVSSFNDRAQILHDDAELHGSWVTLSQLQGNINQQTLELGIDQHRGASRYGIVASYGMGKTNNDGQAKHTLTTLGVYTSWLNQTGWFVDAAARYMRLHQDLHLDPVLGIKNDKQRSNMVAGSVKLGHAFDVVAPSLTLSPYLEASVGYLPRYSLQGEDAGIAISAAMPWSVSPGIEIKKQGLGAALPGISLRAGIAKQYAPGSSHSTLTLEDRHSRRVYSAWNDNRYRLHIGMDGALSDNWSLHVGGKHSGGGQFRPDATLQSSLNYTF
ncbi:S6 family peptidase [Pantoea sp.]|uniref:S6 family peptidase n=1 Tax=Pantoea sp. TaxID=69393 RepID=UPI0031DE7F6E